MTVPYGANVFASQQLLDDGDMREPAFCATIVANDCAAVRSKSGLALGKTDNN